MKKVLHYNNISEELLKTVPKLERGKSVVYKLLSIRPDAFNPGQFIIPALVKTPNKCTIYDPFTKEYCEIGFITGIDLNQGKPEPRFGKIRFTSATGGTLVLTGNNPEHVLLHQYLWLSNDNASNPNRLTETPPIFFYENPEADAIAKRELKRLAREAYDRVSVADMAILVQLASTLGLDRKAPEPVLRLRLEEYAEKHPQRVMSALVDETAPVRITLEKMKEEGKIRYSGKDNRWVTENGQPLASVHKNKADKMTALTEWVNTTDAGKSWFETL